MLQRNALRRSFRRVGGVGVGLSIALLIGSSLIRTVGAAQIKYLHTLSFQQDKVGAGVAPGGAETRALDPGRSIEREISSGQTHAYRIKLDTGKYLRVHVEQQGIDVTVALLAPEGKVVAESKSDNGNFGPEAVSMIAEEPVEVRLEVRARDWEAPSGRYELKIAELRVATEGDRKRVDAERAFAEGMRLSRQGTAVSIRQAGAEYEAALQLFKSLGDRGGEAAAVDKIGQVYNSTSERRKALDTFNQALGLYQSLGERGGESAMGDNQRALEHLNQAQSLRRDLDDPGGLAATLYSIGLVRLSLGERKAALEAFDRALRLWRTVGNRAREAIALEGMARAERDRGNLTEALGRIEVALEIAESLRTKIDENELRASYLGVTQGYYELYIDLLMQSHRIDPSKNHAAAAFQLSERSRARALIETLAESRAKIRNGIEPALLASEGELRKRLESRAESLIRLLGGKHTDERAAAARGEIESLETEYQRLESQIRAASPRYAALTRPQPLSLAEIQRQALDDDALLLEYALGDERSYLWAVTKTSITSHELPPRKEIEQAVHHVRDLLTARNRIARFETMDERQARIAQADSEYPMAAAKLSQMLLSPVADRLEKKRLLIVADGALPEVPFSALPLPATGRPTRGATGGRGGG